MIGAYSAITAVLVTSGRLNFGLQYSTTSRYKTFSLYLIVALIHLAAIIFETKRRGFIFGKEVHARRPLIVAACAFAALYLLASTVAVRHVGMLRTSLLQAKAGVLFMNIIDDRYLKDKIEQRCPSLLSRRGTVNAIDELGFLRPGLIRSNRVRDISGKPELSSGDFGAFERLAHEGSVYVASGRALLPHRGEPADAVLLAYENAEGEPNAFALAEIRNKGDILSKLLADVGTDSYWQQSFPAEALPAGASKVTAWAFDAETGKAFKLAETHAIPGR